MRCPYCVTEIDNASLVCATCKRDLYLFRPLLEKIVSIEEQLKNLSSLKLLEERVAKLELGSQAGKQLPCPEGIDRPVSMLSVRTFSVWPTALMTWVMPLLLLLLSHWLIVVVYDLKTLVLRVVSLLIPLPFGFALAKVSSAQNTPYASKGLVIAISMSLASVMCMSLTTHFVDLVPVIPANARDWREFVEYLSSIAFSFLTGMLLCELWLRCLPGQSVNVSALAVRAAKIVTGGHSAAKQVQATAEKITSVTGAIATTGTSIAAAYTGLRAVVGGS